MIRKLALLLSLLTSLAIAQTQPGIIFGGFGAASLVSIDITPLTATVAPTQTVSYTAIGTYSDNSTADVTNAAGAVWTSSNTSVATMGTLANPEIATAVAVGTTNVTLALNGVTSSTSVITVIKPVLTTTSLPGAVEGTAYSTTLACSGGTAPYTFTKVSGSLPSTLALNTSTGVISGTPAGGTSASSPYALSFSCTDSTPLTSPTVSMNLAVQPSGGAGGAPGYALSTQSQLTTSTGWQPNNTAPFSGTIGVNNTAYDTSIPSQSGGSNPNCITRLSDRNTLGGSYMNPSKSGETNDLMMSKNTNYFFLVSNGAEYLFHGNPSGTCYVVDTPVPTIHFVYAGFSRVTDNKIYYFTSSASGAPNPQGTRLYSNTYTYASGAITAGTPTFLYDFANCPFYAASGTNDSTFGIDNADSVIEASWGTAQNSTGWHQQFIYNIAGNYCDTYDTAPSGGGNGVVHLHTGTNFTTGIGAFGIHNSNLSRDGNWVPVSGATAVCNCAGVEWQVGTTNVLTGAVGTTGAHPAIGYTKHGLGQNPQYNIHLFSDPACTIGADCTTLFTLPNGTNAQMHSAWPVPLSDSSYPILVTNSLNAGSLSATGAGALHYPTAYPGPFFDSLFGIAQDGSTRWFTHFYESYNRTENFEGFDTIMSCSQDGNWCMFASDMFYGLGSNTGLGLSGTAPATDTFMVHLR